MTVALSARTIRTWKAIGLGVVPSALAFASGAWALSPAGAGMRILVSSTILSLTWWLVVPLGVVIAASRSRTWWTVLPVGVADVLLFHTLMALSRSADGRMEALLSPAYLLGAAGTMLLPWLIGLLLGLASIAHEPVRHDGAPSADS